MKGRLVSSAACSVRMRYSLPVTASSLSSVTRPTGAICRSFERSEMPLNRAAPETHEICGWQTRVECMATGLQEYRAVVGQPIESSGCGCAGGNDLVGCRNADVEIVMTRIRR